MKKTLLLFLILVFGLSSVLPFAQDRNLAEAAVSSDFRAGRIIDDGVFFNSFTMSAQDIQAFLNAKIANGRCDTNGELPRGNVTRAQYAASQGNPAPFTCLKDYLQTTSSRPAESGLCNQYTGGHKYAAQIIYDVAQACGINPRVLLVLLEKEQSLITDDWPWTVQYQKATGFGCPDTAPCDSEFGAFFDQVYYAARQFKKYGRDATLFRYRANRDNFIQYNPNESCGGSTVFIQNQATAGLYNYTPYQPNQSALSNLYGSGDSCGAYGNRNFWRLFNDWFGPVFVGTVLPPCNAPTAQVLCVFSLTKPSSDVEFLTASVEERNSLVYYHGFRYNGVKFFSGNVITSSSTPIYRVYSPSLNKHYWTASTAEKNALIQGGYLDEGTAFMANSASSNDGYPIKRFVKGTKHVWTVNEGERTVLLTQGYKDEGLVFHSLSPVASEPTANSTQQSVYRLVSPLNKHFWTANRLERDALITYGRYTYEGLAWYGAVSGGTQVYRLYLPSTGAHFWTTSAPEKDAALRSGYTYEGIAWSVTTSTSSTPAYRLYAIKNRSHFYTTNGVEKDALVNNGYTFEGIGWYSNQ